MQTPKFIDGQFVDGTLFNGAIAQILADFELIGSELHTPGLLNPASMAITATGGLGVSVSAPSPFAVLFGSGLVVNANGTVSGATTSTYAIPSSGVATLVPGTGTVTCYVVASYGQIGQQQTQVIGPQAGNPDFTPGFAPFQFYLEGLDTLIISATLTPPDNVATFALAQFPLAAGQSTLNQNAIVSGAIWTYASAVLNPTGITAGTYTGTTVTVSGDGRVTSISNGAFPGRLLNVQTFTNSGTYTPTTGTNMIRVTILGGGGGGGGAVATAAGQFSVGGGGQAGALGIGLITSGFAGNTVTIGGAGAGIAGSAGNAGGGSSFGSHITAPGGAGGSVSIAGAGNVNVPGGFTSSAGTGASIVNIQGQFGGPGLGQGAIIFGFGGTGGSTILGGGGSFGSNPTGQGAGGNGAANNPSTAARAGTAGTAGFCMIEEFS